MNPERRDGWHPVEQCALVAQPWNFFLDDGPLRRGMKLAEMRLRQFGARIRNAGTQALTYGAAGLASFVLPVRQFMAFDDAIRETGAKAQATGTDLKMLNDTALELGRTTSFTAVEVANLMTELGAAGFKPDDINKMTAAVLNLARATRTDAALAAGIMAATLKQWSMGAEHATHVSNVLTLAANRTFNTVESLGEALSYAGPVAADMGVSLEDTVAMLGMLGNVGIQGSNAGTAMRRMTTMTAAEADKMKEIFGVSFLDSAGNARPLIEVFGELGDATKHLATGVRAAKFNEAFGLLGITSASVLSGVAVDARELAQALKDASTEAADTAADMDAGIGGVWRRMTSAIEGTVIAVGQSLEPTLRKVGDTIGEMAGQATAFVKANQGLIVTLAAVALGLTVAGAALIAVGIAAKIAAVGFAILGFVFSIVTSPLLVLTAGIAGLILWMTKAELGAMNLGRGMLQGLGGAWKAIVGRINSGDFAGAMAFAWTAAKAAWEIGVLQLKGVWLSFSAWIQRSFHEFKILMSEAWLSFWDGIEFAGRTMFAGLKDDFQALIDWANRMVGRKVPNRISNLEKLEQERRAREDKRQAMHDAQRAKLNQQLNNGQMQNQRLIAQSEEKLQQMVQVELARQDLQQKNQEIAAAPPSKPAQRMIQQFAQNTAATVDVKRMATEAVDLRSQEGQAEFYRAMGFNPEEKTVAAIENLTETVEDQFERQRRDNANAPRLAGSRKG